MVESTLFIGAVIAGITQLFKLWLPAVESRWTIIIALLVGVIVGLFDQVIGVTDVTVAQGVMTAFAAAGAIATAEKV